MDEGAKKKLLQEKYVQLQLITMQIKQIEEQLEALDQRAAEMVHLRESLKSFATLKAGAKSFAPLGQGMFIESALGDTKSVLINVGAGIIVKKSAGDAEKTITAQMDQIQAITVELGENLRELAVRAHELETEVDSLA